MHIIIVGGGNVGYFLAKKLLADKHIISIVEKNKERCKEIAAGINALVIHGDGCDPKYLEEAGIEKADVVAAVTGKDEDNLVVCQLAKELFNTSRTVGRINDPSNTSAFNELEVDVPIDSTAIIAKIIEEEVSLDDIVTLMTFKKGKLSLVRIDITEDSPVNEKQVKDIKFPPDAVLVSILRGSKVIIPRGDTVFQPKDDVIALTTIENEKQLLNILLGKIDTKEKK